MIVKCQSCHKWDQEYRVACSKCGATSLLCSSCKSEYNLKVTKCPSCNMSPMWKIESMSSGGQHLGSAKSAWEFYEGSKARRQEKRNEEGGGQHHGVNLPAEQVSVLRELEDSIKAEIVLQEPGKGKNNTYVARDGKVVELYLSPEYTPTNSELLEKIAKIQSLEGLAIRALSSATPFAPLVAMPGFKRLAIASSSNAQYAMKLTTDMIAGICSISQLEELNIAYLEVDPPILDQHLVRLKNLKKLNISGIRSPQNDQFPKSIGQLSGLEELAISGLHSSGSKPVIPSGLENLPKIKLVHMDYEQNGLGILWGKLRAKLEENNPAVYPKKSLKEKGLGFLKAVVSETKTMSEKAQDYQKTLPEPLKKGWSGISFQA